MAIVKPFKGYRPPEDIAEDLACLPYDVMNATEAAQMAEGKACSLLHITRSEIDCAAGVDVHSDVVYDKAVANFNLFKEKGWLIQEDVAKFYIYAQTMNGRTQYGLVGAASVQDYLDGIVKKHELTRSEKEEDRMIHVRINNANIEPVFLSYPALPELDEIVNNIVVNEMPVYDFTAEGDGFGHHFWVVEDAATNARIEELFATQVPATYVADGHHRTAAAALIAAEKKAANPNHTGDEAYNFFLAVHFPDNQLEIIDYNRVVKDLNGLSEAELVAQIADDFIVEEMGTELCKPSKLHEFSMYMAGKWYKMTAKEGRYDDNDPIGVLDVTILSNLILDKQLGIKDLRTDKRIDFVGGIRGLDELSKRVDKGEMAVAFALYAVSMKQLIDIADSGNIMPPKTTWFEPKLRSGLVIHELE
jgi:uncharacterized protein (DUF1015 family)